MPAATRLEDGYLAIVCPAGPFALCQFEQICYVGRAQDIALERTGSLEHRDSVFPSISAPIVAGPVAGGRSGIRGLNFGSGRLR